MASHPSFQSGDVHTGFIDQHLDSLFPPIEISNQTVCQAVAALVESERIVAFAHALQQGCNNNPFSLDDGFRLNGMAYTRDFELESNGTKYDIQLKYIGKDFEIKINDSDWEPLTAETVEDSHPDRFTLKLNLDGNQSIFSAVIVDGTIDIFNEVSFQPKIFTIFFHFQYKLIKLFNDCCRMEKLN